MRLIVLGSAAGGGVPQWNCKCRVCELAWTGVGAVRRRTQFGLAISSSSNRFLLVNASPDLRQQMLDCDALHPRVGQRHTTIEAVVLTGAEVDNVAGLLSLRERQPFRLFATGAVLQTLAANSMFGVLATDVVERVACKTDGSGFEAAGLRVRAFATPGKPALYQEGDAASIGSETDDVIGLEITSGARRVVCIPACAQVTDEILRCATGADVLLFDGTTSTDTEMIDQGLSTKTARRMGHVAMTGAEGAIARFSGVQVGRKIFVHINNSNPVLIEGSRERMVVERAGWEVAFDGMDISLGAENDAPPSTR